ncbi:MAG: hypothetical protein ACOZIN_01940 [Myxococcota bacterium]
MRRARMLSLVTAALAVAGAVGAPGCGVGTALFIVVDMGEVQATQLRFLGSAGGEQLVGATRPEVVKGNLSGQQSLRVLLEDALDGKVVRIEVEALRDGQVVAFGAAESTIIAKREVTVTVRLGGAGGTDGGTDAGGGDGGPGTDGGAGDGGIELRPVCSSEGWCWENPLPTGNHILAVHGTAANNVYAVGQLGLILHFDGRVWQALVSPVKDVQLNAVWARAANDIWVMGNGGTILHSTDGRTFAPEGPSNLPADLLGVWAESADRIVVVGAATAAGTNSGVILEKTSAGWSSPSAFSSGAFTAVHGVGTDVWVVSKDGAVYRRGNGTSWQAQSLPLGGPLRGFNAVWALGPNDVWVVGGSATLHFNGTAWVQQNLPLSFDARDVWGSVEGEVLVAGSNGQLARRTATSSGWTTSASGSARGLLGLFGANESEVWAVGERGLLARRVNQVWSVLHEVSMSNLHAAWSGPQEEWVVGAGGTVLRSVQKGPWKRESSTTNVDLEGVWGFPDAGTVWVTGGNLIRYWERDRWVDANDGGLSGPFNAVWGASPDDVWVVGGSAAAGGRLVRCRNRSCLLDPYTPGAALNGLHGTSSTDVWAVGDRTIVLRFDGTRWQPVAMSSQDFSVPPTLRAVWGRPNDMVVVGGDLQAAFGRANNLGGAVTTPATYLPPVNGVRGDAATGAAWAVGHGGLIVLVPPGSSGGSLSISGTANTLFGVTAEGLVVGEGGTILRKR